ncbi:hypothetical protein [Brachybacterium epidermidis]|uniref:hypothetical protein n=1 Tax=Brachybacterium epidermidis TaxID=2781983 RepID=UPI00398F50D5
MVELSDGRVLLNIRASGSRLNAISEDGGVTYTEPARDSQQVEPGCNGSVSRVFPDADESDPRARMILLVNAENPAIRRNVTAKLSYDDGQAWPGRVVLEHGSSAYATATPLGDGRMAILLEREGYSVISHCVLDTERMGALPAPLRAPENIVLTAGQTHEIVLTVDNQGRGAVPQGPSL